MPIPESSARRGKTRADAQPRVKSTWQGGKTPTCDKPRDLSSNQESGVEGKRARRQTIANCKLSDANCELAKRGFHPICAMQRALCESYRDANRMARSRWRGERKRGAA